MPRRGEHRWGFAPVAEPEAPVDRIGLRVVRVPDRTGTIRSVTFDPNEFRCAALACELADEWVDYVEVAKVTGSSAMTIRRAVRDFCDHVDRGFGEQARDAGLGRPHPDLGASLAEWERTLPAGFRRER
jgi:hypothetical protein